MKKIAVVTIVFLLLLATWSFILCRYRYNEQVLFPAGAFEVYALTDNSAGGFSTCALSRTDSSITADINIRSGMAYPYAGVGFNLMSVNNRPAVNFYDFARFDSLVIEVETVRMRNISVRLLNNDPVYSKANAYLSYRPLVASTAVGTFSKPTKLSLLDFKVPEWWLSAQGLENDDGQRYMDRGVILEVFNGEGTLRGIPDQIELRSIKLFGINRNFVNLMIVVLALMVIVFVVAVAYFYRTNPKRIAHKKESLAQLEKQMAPAAEMLLNSDRSVAEIALAVGEKSSNQFEKKFAKVFGVKPLEYRSRK